MVAFTRKLFNSTNLKYGEGADVNKKNLVCYQFRLKAVPLFALKFNGTNAKPRIVILVTHGSSVRHSPLLDFRVDSKVKVKSLY